MLSEAAKWLSTLKGSAMRKNMYGDVVVCVIDEIGEVTFCEVVMHKTVGVCSDIETAERTLAAVAELLNIVASVLPVSASGFAAKQAFELLMRDFKPLADRLSEQIEFQRSVPKD